jgi:hypothetical protein
LPRTLTNRQEIFVTLFQLILGIINPNVFFWAFFWSCQERLYQEIREVCGDETVTEEHLPRLPYLNAVFHETLRRHSPVPLIPPRFVHEDTKLAGYDVPAGTEVSTTIRQWQGLHFQFGPKFQLFRCRQNFSDFGVTEISQTLVFLVLIFARNYLKF